MVAALVSAILSAPWPVVCRRIRRLLYLDDPHISQHFETSFVMAAALLQTPMHCRPRCGACCIAPSIASPIPGMPYGKPAGMPCVQLDDDLRCRLFGRPERPAFCASLRPEPGMCGTARDEAMALLAALEAATRPD